jgi:NTE family protein
MRALFTTLAVCWMLSSVAVAAAGARPRVGLVLSGGGARGAAHIGVLKALDAMHVQVDAIAGTSMGAVVGGLYASGMSGVEIEQLLSTLDWQDAFRDRPKRSELAFRRKRDDEDFLVNVPLGLRGRKLLIPTGLIAGQKLTQLLRKATLPVATIDDFDHLPTPLRVVATDLETGAAVVMGNGDLTSALRASMSAPGAFAPVERDGRLLVDGGLVKNLPVDVARSMGVDVLIVVDTGLPLQDRTQLTSLASVSNQSVAIMVRRDSDLQRATLSARDVLLMPQLGDTSSFDFRIVRRIIDTGTAAAEAARSSLARYAVDDDAFASYVAARQALRGSLPAVQFVRADAASAPYQRLINNSFADQAGKPLDPAVVADRVTTLYGRGTFETVDYRVARDAQLGTGLEIGARRNSWGPNYLRLGLSLQDDFQGNTSFNAAARFLFTELNALGAELSLDVQAGAAPRLASELYLPLSDRTHYFLAPHAQFEAHNVAQLVPDPATGGNRQVGEIRVRGVDVGLDAGREFGNWGELRGGLLHTQGTERVRLGDFSDPNKRFALDAAFVRFSYDRLDAANFPHHGQSLRLEWRVEGNGSNSVDPGSDLLKLDWRAAATRGKNTAVVWVSGGTTVSGSQNNVRSFFPLGGFLNLSGVRADTLAGPHYGIARAILLRKVGSGGEGVLNVPAYAGVSLEAGNVWSQRTQVSFTGLHRDVSVFFGADTYIGPAYLAAAYDDRGNSAFYLFLGRSF